MRGTRGRPTSAAEWNERTATTNSDGRGTAVLLTWPLVEIDYLDASVSRFGGNSCRVSEKHRRLCGRCSKISSWRGEMGGVLALAESRQTRRLRALLL